MTFITELGSKISSGNSTATPLDSYSDFTGTYDSVIDYANITILVSTDNNINSLLICQFSIDGSTTAAEINLNNGINNDINGFHSISPQSTYFRLIVTNLDNPQTFLKVQTIFNSHQKNEIAVKSAVCGTLSNNKSTQILANNLNQLKVSLGSHYSSNELIMSKSEIVSQVNFIYGINTATTYTYTTNTATVTASAGSGELLCIAVPESIAYATGKQIINCNNGQSCVSKFSAKFESSFGSATRLAGIGVINSGNSITDGLFFGMTGETFNIVLYVDQSFYTTQQQNWNIDKCDGTNSIYNPSGYMFDPAICHNFQIRYQPVGYSTIFFYIENSFGEMIPVHKISGTSINMSTIIQPNFNLIWYVDGNDTTAILKSNGGAIYLEGPANNLNQTFGINNYKTLSPFTELSMLSLTNATVFKDISNRIPIKLTHLSACADQIGLLIIKLILNCTLVSPTWISPDNESGAFYDVSLSNYSNGTVVYNTTATQDININLSDLNIILYPGDLLTISATDTVDCNVNVSLTFSKIW